MTYKSTEVIDTDRFIKELGDFGTYQKLIVLLLMIPILFWGAAVVSFVFTAGNLDYRCQIDECDTDGILYYNKPWIESGIPYTNGKLSKCTHYKLLENKTNEDECEEGDFDQSTVITCDQFIYIDNERTILNEFGLNCPENEWKLTLVGSINNVAQLIFIFFSGFFSDKYGRLKIFVLCMMLSALFGVLRSIATSYIMYLIMEFLFAGFGSGVYGSAFVLIMEIMGPHKRLFAAAACAISFSIGEAFIGFIAMNVLNFRTALQILHIPTFLFITYYWIIPESMRWLFAQNRINEARKIILKAAKFNKIQLTDSTLEILNSVPESIDKSLSDPSGIVNNNVDNSVKYSLKDVFKSSYLIISLMINCFCWFTSAFVYYGLSFNSVSLSGDKFINFILVCLAEIPGQILTVLLIDRIGRRWTLFGGFIICGITCIVSQYLPDHLAALSLTLFLIGKAFISMIFSVIYIITTELYPTNLRHTLMTTCSMVGRTGSILAAQTPLLANVMAALPFILFSVTSLTAGFLSLKFPETMKAKLPDTIEEAENMGKNRKLPQ